VPAVVAINRFSADTEAEMEAIAAFCRGRGVPVSICSHWAEGSKGTIDLAQQVVEAAACGRASFKPLYADDLSLADKARAIAREIYGAEDVFLDGPAAA